jgi:hypothetical protein
MRIFRLDSAAPGDCKLSPSLPYEGGSIASIILPDLRPTLSVGCGNGGSDLWTTNVWQWVP